MDDQSASLVPHYPCNDFRRYDFIIFLYGGMVVDLINNKVCIWIFLTLHYSALTFLINSKRNTLWYCSLLIHHDSVEVLKLCGFKCRISGRCLLLRKFQDKLWLKTSRFGAYIANTVSPDSLKTFLLNRFILIGTQFQILFMSQPKDL